jgi:hypothetical protein
VKVAIGQRLHEGPWGGGNRFARALHAALLAAGHRVVDTLRDDDIDVIVLTAPWRRGPVVSFGAGAVLRYLLLRNAGALVVQRINECDERKGTRHMNDALARAHYAADFTVFVGAWLVGLPVWRRHLRSPHAVIRNGADTALFNATNYRAWTGEGPLRLVTHHWGGNWMKGFDIYAALDAMLADPAWRDRIAFTYIGNLPAGFRFANTRYVPPLDGAALAAELAAHHAYVTGSINEPGGNHQNEGALCGLPLLYRNSGSLPEYCNGFGVAFDGCDDFPGALDRLIGLYGRLAARMPDYPHTATRMTQAWLALFEDLTARREALVSARRLWRSPWLVLRNQLPL